MATWGVKVSDELKDKLAAAMRESGLEGQDFVDQLYTLYAAEIMKKEKPALATELEELQKLTQRIYSIYLNANERTDNLLQAKEDTFQSALSELREQIQGLKGELGSKEADYEALQEAYNSLSEEKAEVDTRVTELTDTINTQKELVEQYKEKNDTLTEIINEYKEYKKENFELEHLIHERIDELRQSQSTVATLEEKITLLKERIAAIESDNKTKVQTLNDSHEQALEGLKASLELGKGKAILELEQKHQKALSELTEKFNSKLESVTDKLEAERELNAKLKEENINLKAAKKESHTPKTNNTRGGKTNG